MPPIDPQIGPEGNVLQQSPLSLFQMAGQATSGGGGTGLDNPWAPDWVKQQLPGALAEFYARSGTQPSSDYRAAFAPTPGNLPPGVLAGPGVMTDNGVRMGLGANPGFLDPQLNPDNWGPPPDNGQPPNVQGSRGGGDPRGKFWSQRAASQAYNKRFPGGSEVADERPNTSNWRMLGGDPGDFMFLGHHINQPKRDYDRLIGYSPPAGLEGGNVPRGPMKAIPPGLFGPEAQAMWMAQVGIPGQLDPMWDYWGAGGHGG